MTDQFYEKHYGRNPTPARIKAVAKALAPKLGQKTRWLDIGCGNLDTSIALIEELKRLGVTSEITVTGWDVSNTAVHAVRARDYNAEVRDVSTCEIAETDQGAWDVVLFLEVLEHLVDTDTTLRNIHSLLAPKALLVLSVPNLAAWYNRILLLVGFQPHGTEVSYAPYRFGLQFMGRVLGEEPGVAATAVGHLRSFTLRALRELLAYHGFAVRKVIGISNHKWDLVGRCVAKIWPSGSGNVLIIADRSCE